MADKPAQDKRTKISKAQQITMLEVLGASLVLGTCLVLVNFIVKYIDFNAKVISKKNEAIAAYEQAIRNIGVCIDENDDKHMSDAELNKCDPNAVSTNEVKGSLRYNVFEVMAQNEELESVARKRNSDCYNDDGSKVDFNWVYQNATDDKQREVALQALKICSALRVIPDALPAQKNTEALMASLNQLFLVSNWEPTSIAPRDENILIEDIAGVEAIPVTFQVEGDGATIIKVLKNIDRSIREFDITTASIEWTNKGLRLQARANAFYLNNFWELEKTQVVRAGDKK